MAKYIVDLQTRAFTSITVEADSPEDAYDKALDARLPTICAQCSGWGKESVNLELGDQWDIDPDRPLADQVEKIED